MRELQIPALIARDLVSPWLARRDADWWIDRLYDFGAALGATVVRTCHVTHGDRCKP